MRLSKPHFFDYFKRFACFIDINKRWLVVILAIFFHFIFFASLVRADYPRYSPGESVTLGEFVFDDNYLPSTVSCSTTVYNPSGSIVVNDVQLTALASGWHYYTFTPASTVGLWSASIYCGSSANGDLIKTDKSFVVAYNRLSDKTLIGGGSLATEAYVDTATSSLKSEIDQNQTLISALNNISANDVWSFAGRDLDRPTILMASTSAAIWERATTTLVASGSIGKLIADNIDAQISSRGTSSLSATDVWNAASRTLTDYATSTMVQAVWANAARTLTNYGNDITAADVWNILTSTINTVGSFGAQIKENSDFKSSQIYSEIIQNRNLINSLNNISATDVWSYVGRDLDNPVTVSASTSKAVWAVATSTLNTSGTIGKQIADYLDVKVSTVGGGSLTAADIWSAANRTLTDYATSTVTQAVWANAARTLTNYGNDITAADVWSVLTSTLNTIGSVGKQIRDNTDIKTSEVYNEVIQNRSLINSLNDISASDVWSFVGRDLDHPTIVTASTSEAIWNFGVSSLSNSGTIGKLIADNLDAKISTRGTSSLTAGDVWNVANRTLTDYATSSITQAIWSNANRTLTSYGNDITAADVWNVLSTSLIANNTIGKLLADNVDAKVSSVANSVWSSGTRTLTDYATSSIATSVWNSPVRSLSTFGTLASDVWSDLTAPTRLLTGKSLTSGGSIATENYLSSSLSAATSSIINEVIQNRTLINNLNNISAADVWSYVGRDLDRPTVVTASTSAAVWAIATSSLGASGTIGKLIADNLDAKISTRGTSVLTAADVWDAANRSLTDYSTSSIALSVWSNSARTLTSYGNNISAADVWNVLTSTINIVGSIGKQLSENSDVKASQIYNEVQQNQVLINNLNNISATDVWNVANRSLTDYSTTSIAQAVWGSGTRSLTNYGNNLSAADVWSFVGRDLDNPSSLVSSTSAAVWDKAVSSLTNSGTIGRLIANNLDAQVSSRGTSSITAADIWSAANRTLTDYATSSLALAVWQNANRTLTSYGASITAADVWNALTSTLTTVGSIGKQLTDNLDISLSTRAALSSQQAGWDVSMSDVDSISAGKTYRAKVYVLNFESVPTDSFSNPRITLYDASRNVIISSVPLNKVDTGVYEYTYFVPNNAESGLWESSISTEVTSGKLLQTNDFWVVAASPAQVIINDITDNEAPTISANVTITNEGLSGYEYQYEWCVVSSADNQCGGGNDVFYASAAKFINPGEDWNTNLTATVPNNGNYLFKLVVYFGTESSGSSRTFNVVGGSTEPVVNPPVGGGGGGGGITPVLPNNTTTPVVIKCSGADFNIDKKVNSIDFSILLAYWKTKPPFRNPCVDLNKDSSIDSIDFSILMYEWGTKK